jgi:hypothetical protein
MMNDGMMFALLTGAVLGAVITTMCKPAREMVQKSADAIEEKVKAISKKVSNQQKSNN